jgi:hypothetical protein
MWVVVTVVTDDHGGDPGKKQDVGDRKKVDICVSFLIVTYKVYIGTACTSNTAGGHK